MKLFIIALLYFIALIIYVVTGYVLLRKASKYPNTDIGYHIESAMKDKKTWEKTNKFAGIFCIICGISGYGFLPIVTYVITASWQFILCQYFITSFLFILGVLFLPRIFIRNN